MRSAISLRFRFHNMRSWPTVGFHKFRNLKMTTSVMFRLLFGDHFLILTILIGHHTLATAASNKLELVPTVAGIFSHHGARCVRLVNVDPSELDKMMLDMTFKTFGLSDYDIERDSGAFQDCPNLFAKFQNNEVALEFLNKVFIRPTSLAVAIVEAPLTYHNKEAAKATSNPVKAIMTSKAFKSALEVALLVKLDPTSQTMTAFAHDVAGAADAAKSIDVWTAGASGKMRFLRGGRAFFTESMRNLHGRTIKAVSFDFPPFSTSRVSEPGEEAVYDGIELKTFYEVGDIMNFRYEVNEPQTGVKWGGIMSDVIQGVADIGTGHLFLTYGRVQVADATPAINVDYFCLLVPQAQTEARWKALYRPLEWDTWLGLAVTFLACVAFVLVYVRVQRQPEFDSSVLTFYLVRTFIDNSHEETFKIRHNSLRVFVILFLLGFFVLATGYRGSLISHQLVPAVAQPMQTIEEVIDSEYDVYSLGRVVKDNLKYSEDPLMRELDKKYFIHDDLNQAFVNVSVGERVLIEVQQMSNYRIAQGFIDRYGTPSIHMGDCLQHYDIVFYMTKNSIYGPAISEVIEGLKEAGIANKLVKDGTGESDKTRGRQSTVQEGNATLSLTAMQGPFVLEALLLGVCLIVLIAEMMVGRKRTDRTMLLRET